MTRPLPIALVGPSANGVATAAAMSGGRDQAELADYLMQVGHALNLVCELPEWLERSPLPKHLRHAAVECFAMNCRVLVEFLWSTARYGSDVRACDYCGGATIDRPVPPAAKSYGDKQVLSDATNNGWTVDDMDEIAGFRAAIADALRANTGQLGEVFAALEEDITEPRQIVERTSVANTGAVSNLLAQIEAALDGTVPQSPSRARQTAGALRGLCKANPTLPHGARKHLEAVIDRCDAVSSDSRAVAEESAELKEQSDRLGKDLSTGGGVYVYTLPHYRRHPYVDGTDLHLFKVGMTTGDAAARIQAQATTGVPEDPVILRVYRCPNGRPPAELERAFHKTLIAARHAQPRAGSGKEWFATTLDLLDVVAELLGLEAHGQD